MKTDDPTEKDAREPHVEEAGAEASEAEESIASATGAAKKGVATKTGAALLGLFGRKAAVETSTNFGRQVLRQAVGSARAAA